MTLRIAATAVIAALIAVPLEARADAQYKKPLKEAARALDDAETKADRAGGRCRAALSDPLDNAAEKARDLRKGNAPRAREIAQLRAEVSGYATSATFSGCPFPVLESLQRALDHLEEARVALWSERRGGDDDDRGGQDGRQSAYAQLAALVVQTNATFDGERAVKLSVPELRLTNMQGRTFYLGARFRSYEGQWSDWVTTSAWTVPSEPFVWKNAFNHFLRYSTLAEEDFSQGRFVARVSVFDSTGAELAFREVTFKVGLPQLPPAPAQPPPPVQPLPPPVVQRDCGTGNDVGCTMTRDGAYALDAAAWNSLLNALRATPSEGQRQRICEGAFQRSYVTAFQLGMVLDLFGNEATRLIVARFAAPRVVNPQHALGYASKWPTPALAQQYTQVMTAQLPPGLPPPTPGLPPVRPPPPMPPPPPGPPAYRDCGTGADPGCSMTRNGIQPMDGTTYQGLLASMRTTINDFGRRDMAIDVVHTSGVTALQLAGLMDQFSSDFARLDVAKACAPRLVNPQHALGFASKFTNSLVGQDYVKVITAEMGR